MALRVTFGVGESLQDANSNLRSTGTLLEHLEDRPAPNVRATFALGEHLFDTSTRQLRSTRLLLEYIIAVGPFEGKTQSELVMSTEPYPELIGLSWPVKQKPNFSTNIQTHTSGRETRNAYFENPIWDFELTYDYLPDVADQKDADYKTLVGFFLARRGAYDTFLFFNNGDRQINNGYIGTADGTTVQFQFAKQWGGHLEPVGFVDTGNPISVFVELTESIVIASGTATPSHGAQLQSTTSVKIGATTLTQVASAPGMNEYSYAAGVFTFNAGRNGQTVDINYTYLAVQGAGNDYTITLPNEIVFNIAPPANAVITATFGYAYVCRFTDDAADFDQFMDKLYELDKISLRSVIL